MQKLVLISVSIWMHLPVLKIAVHIKLLLGNNSYEIEGRNMQGPQNTLIKLYEEMIKSVKSKSNPSIILVMILAPSALRLVCVNTSIEHKFKL